MKVTARRRGALDRRRRCGAVPRRARSGSARRTARAVPGGRRATRCRSCCAATRAHTARSPRRRSRAYGLEPQRAVEALTALERAEKWCAARSARAPTARRQRARVVRPRRPTPPAPRQPRRPAQGDRAHRPGHACALRRSLARHRPIRAQRSEGGGRADAARRRAGPAARGAGSAAGIGLDSRDVGARRAAPAARPLRPGVARPAVRGGRGRLDRRRQRLGPWRPRGPVLPRGCTVSGSAAGDVGRRAARPRCTMRCGSGSRQALRSGRTCSSTSTCRRSTCARRCGTWCGPGRSRTTPSRRCARGACRWRRRSIAAVAAGPVRSHGARAPSRRSRAAGA